MTALCEPNTPAEPLPRHVKVWIVGALTLTILGDFLFYNRSLGISVPLFCVALALGAAISNTSGLTLRRLLIVAAVLIVSLLPLLEALTPLSLMFGIAGTAICCVIVSTEARRDMMTILDHAAALIITGAFRLVPDALRLRAFSSSKGGVIAISALLGWVIPVLLSLIFVLLFSIANPLMEAVVASLNPAALAQEFEPARALFWAMLISVTWGCLAFGLRTPVNVSDTVQQHVGPVAIPSLPEEVTRRSLILFNLLFAAQSMMDILYLWGGVSLPDGLSYASYAHRGAYPLIVTALLAAAFVLATLRPGGDTERSGFIRLMVYLWVAQNVLLVISSILRLDLYVEIYAMTRWRLAAFIWMVLVAIGLVLIILRIALGRSNRWLMMSNAVVLTVVLYGCAFINVPRVIASYNVAHSGDRSNGALAMDIEYLQLLGPQVIPALDRCLRDAGCSGGHADMRSQLADSHAIRMQDWRAWTFRDWRLERYLAHQATGTFVTPPNDTGSKPSPNEDFSQ